MSVQGVHHVLRVGDELSEGVDLGPVALILLEQLGSAESAA